MPTLGRHLSLKLLDDRCIGTTPEERRLIAQVVLSQGRRDHVIALGEPDNHIHIYAGCTRAAGNRLAQRVESSLKQRLGLEVGFRPVWNKALRDGHHPRSLTRYIFTQAAHHGVPDDPLFESTNLPDLLGLRLIGRYTIGNVKRWVRRFGAADLLECLQVPRLVPRDGPLEHLPLATLAATALPHLRGKTPEVMAAKRAFVSIVGKRLAAPALGERLGVSRRTVFDLRRQPAEPALVHAIRLQLDLIRQKCPDQTLAAPFPTEDRVTAGGGGSRGARRSR